jgi:decaprenylphospho-beta-D-erythro-pentofuranosid-2-ulose 2-reductase
MKKIVIIGAASAIAEAIARQYAKSGDHLLLVGRSQERLETLASDLKIRGATEVDCLTFDANDFAGHQGLVDNVAGKLDEIDVALIAHGTLPDQQACQADPTLALQEITTNGVSVISLLSYLANVFEKQRHGTIAVLSSPAGDRGRQSNYVYGAAKGAVSVFMQGLRNRLFRAGVHVLTIKPGFVDTPMTVNFKKGVLWSTPDKIAPIIVNAIERQKDTLYAPWFWQFIMLIIKSIPEVIFKRLKL